MKNALGFLLILGGGYFAGKKLGWFGGGFSQAAVGAGETGPAVIMPNEAQPRIPPTLTPPVKPPAPPVIPAQTPPSLVKQVLSKYDLQTKLQELGGTGQLSVDQWNYYLSQLLPDATVTDLGVARDGNDLFYAGQYLDMRTSQGLAGLAAAYGRRIFPMASRINYRRVG